jgi:hypothetical protein
MTAGQPGMAPDGTAVPARARRRLPASAQDPYESLPAFQASFGSSAEWCLQTGRGQALGLELDPVHVWSTRYRSRAVPNGLQRYIISPVAGTILQKQAQVQNPDKDEVRRFTAGQCGRRRLLSSKRSHRAPRKQSTLRLGRSNHRLAQVAVGSAGAFLARLDSHNNAVLRHFPSPLILKVI